jgi:hypothetical protein
MTRRTDLKTLRLALFVLVIWCSAFSALAQTAVAGPVVPKQPAPNPAEWSNYYYVAVNLERVYPHSLGYMVTYRKGMADIGRSYLPMKWFQAAGGKAALVKIKGGQLWPYMVIYYKDGKFDHLRLYVRESLGHQSWGVLSTPAQFDAKFNVEDFVME